MSVKASANRFPLDSLLVLRAAGLSSLTATAATAGIDLGVLTSYWAQYDVAAPEEFAVEFNFTAWDHTTGDETYVVTIEVDTTSAFGSPVIIDTYTVTSIAGRVTKLVARETLVTALGATPAGGFIRVNATLGGTTPILGYDAYLSPVT